MRTRHARRAWRTIQLGVGYSKTAFDVGFSRSRLIEEVTNETMQIYRVCQELFREHYTGKPVRQISFSISNLEEESSLQISLVEVRKWENRKLGKQWTTFETNTGTWPFTGQSQGQKLERRRPERS